MKLLLVNWVEPWVRSVSTIQKYVHAAAALGHSVAVYGEVGVYGSQRAEMPWLPFTTDLDGVDLALFIVQVPADFPDMPYLARLIDGIPRERRVVVDLWGRFNETIRLDHDFNHLEKLDGHMGWEWVEAMQAVSDTILQPTLAPLRPDVRSFLFHGFDPGSVARRHETARDAAAAWREAGPEEKPYGMIYVGSNWQRWGQVKPFLQKYGKAGRDQFGPACIVGWDWSERPEWAVKKGIVGVDADPALLADLGVEVRSGVRFDEVVGLLGKARFAPVFHRPLFRHLGLVTNRTFETFHADTLPVLMLPRDFVAAIYGGAALALVPGEDVSAHLADALRRPEPYWEAVLQTRAHLARHHSYARRYEELANLFEERKVPARAGVP
jgi:hypothetical protein